MQNYKYIEASHRVTMPANACYDQLMNLTEFDIIRVLTERQKTLTSTTKIGIGDDAAIIGNNTKNDIAISIDTLNSGIHFPANTAPYDIGYKSLAVSLSDMAAMSAQPFAVLLSLSLPTANATWIAEFSDGFFKLLDQYQLDLIGGDTTRGPLSISTVVHGWVPKNDSLLRSGAQPGDLIYVSGTLGDAGYALKNLKSKQLDPYFVNRLNRPQPRIELGLALRSVATAAIDISDGLITDLKKILHASHVGATIEAAKLPLSSQLVKHCSVKEAWQFALSSGDDYELCFTIPASQQKLLSERIKNISCTIQCIGKITSTLELTILDEKELPLIIHQEGYEHFRSVE